jgi:hypothetical protein
MEFRSTTKPKKEPRRYFGPKEFNRKKLNKQNLIFSIIAVIIILLLIVIVISSLTLLIKQINLSFKPSSPSNAIEQFDINGFEAIKNKIPGYVELSPTPSPTVESAVVDVSTTTLIVVPSASSTLEVTPTSSFKPTITPISTLEIIP